MQQSPAAAARGPHFGLAGRRGGGAAALVDYILVAEFDIDSGSTVRHAYPSSVPGVSDDWFAEHMLPEGAHNHALDWTVMFLNRDKPAIDENWPPQLESDSTDLSASQESSSSAGGVNVVGGESFKPRLAGDGEEEGERGRHFLHCINLVRKQDDPNARRGAVVKAMCVCSRYNYIEVFRPMLMLALEQYFQSQVPEVLAYLFDVLNAADIAGAPRPYPWERTLMRRGVADKYMGTVPVEHLTSTWTHMMTFKYGERAVQAAIPLYFFPDETLTTSVTLLVNLFGQSVVTIYNAVLTGRRVLFVGYNHAAGHVCQIVLAACALVSPPINGILHRAYPYASLSDLSFLETPSFVAGVTNPMFESHPEWWDVLCQLDPPGGSGSVITAEEMTSESGGSVHRGKPSVGAGNSASAGTGEERFKGKDAGLAFPGDSAFATTLMSGLKAGKGESWARSECLDYTQGLVNLVLDNDAGLAGQLSSGSLDKPSSANESRLRRLRSAGGITQRDTDPWARCRGKGGGAAACGKGVELRNFIRRMQLDKIIEESSATEAFELLSGCLITEAELQVLLGLLPESKGGAGLLALGLLSTSASARRSTVILFKKLESFESTRPAVLCMNDFFKLALSRQGQEWEKASPLTLEPTAAAAAGVGGFSVGGGREPAEVEGGGGRVPGYRSVHA